MVTPKVGFVVYGVHKDGLADPMGVPFIDPAIVAAAKKALRAAGMELVEHDVVVASKQEARDCFRSLAKIDDLDATVLFAGTWVWAAHLVGALREFAGTRKAIVLWTNPGSQGWRPVGGLVMHGGLREVGIPHRWVYGWHDDPVEVSRIVSYCRAAHERRRLSNSTIGAFGGRGMGQSCGVADPSQWMRMFGIDIDSRDTTELMKSARAVSPERLAAARRDLAKRFSQPITAGDVADRSIRLYLAIGDIVRREGWEFYTLQSFPGLGDDYAATCFAQSMMLDDGWGTSTLSDFNTALTVKLLTDLSRERVYYGDLQHIDKPTREIKIIGDGACPPSLAGRAGPAGFAEHGIPTEGAAGGLSVKLVCKPGRGVLARLGRADGEFEMAVARCEVFEPPAAELERRTRECGIPFWPHAFVRVEGDIERLVQCWNNEYAVLGYGEHLYDELAAFCELTGIRPLLL
jgi:L-fucose isomerase-like protein